jgi:predicted RNA-binding Zn ribbon-like protein
MPKGKDHFDWSGGHAALDFVNTLDERPLPEPIENLADYADLVSFAAIARLITPTHARGLRKLSGIAPARAVRRARKLREDVFEALTALRRRRTVSSATLHRITYAIRGAHAARTLSISTSASLARYGWASPQAADIPLHACALAIEDLLTSADRSRIRKCGAGNCEVYFIDRSKGRRRHWCSMANCGNREKQRRWRAT